VLRRPVELATGFSHSTVNKERCYDKQYLSLACLPECGHYWMISVNDRQTTHYAKQSGADADKKMDSRDGYIMRPGEYG